MNSAGRRCALLCHSGPGWQRHTNTQRASCTLAPSSLVSSALQRHYCCSGSTLSRQCCLFCGPWHRWLVCLASPAFSAILLRPHVKPLIKLIKKKRGEQILSSGRPSPPVLHSLFLLPTSSSYSVSVDPVSAVYVLKDRWEQKQTE